MTAAIEKLSKFAALAVSVLTISACGFRPIYATPDGAIAPINKQIAIGPITAPEEVHLYISDALRDRIVMRADTAPKYELTVIASEAAQRLAVQIDATVTRYNYRLTGLYLLRDLETQKVHEGKAQAITSYNIVSSQYSTLFAERTAREKAARLLAEEIERDILLRLADPTDTPTARENIDFDDPATIEEIGEPQDSFESGDQPFLIDESRRTEDPS